MSDFFNSEIVQWVLATLIGMLILGILGWLQFKRDEKIVAEFLKRSGIEVPEEIRNRNQSLLQNHPGNFFSH